jgi:hypothetical protein
MPWVGGSRFLLPFTANIVGLFWIFVFPVLLGFPVAFLTPISKTILGGFIFPKFCF